MLDSKVLIGLMALLGVGLAVTQLWLKRLLAQLLSAPGDWVERIPVALGSGYFWATGLGFLANVSLWLWILPKAKLSVVYPMLSFSYVVMLFLEFAVERQPVSALNLAGVGFVVLGVVLLGWNR